MIKECRDETQHKPRSLVNTALEVVKEELENINSDQRITIALKILQNVKLNTYLYEAIGFSKTENVKSKMWNDDFEEIYIIIFANSDLLKSNFSKSKTPT